MPYGSRTTFRDDGNISQTLNGAPFGTPFTVVGRYYRHGTVAYSRTGTNHNKLEVKTCVVKRKPDGPLEWRLVTIPGGARLAYKVYSKRLNKYVWARQPVKVPRLVRTWKKRPRSKKELNLTPNALNYSSACVSYFGDGTSVITSKDLYSSNTVTATGALWAPFIPAGASNPIGVNADNYSAIGISSRFDSYTTQADSIASKRLYTRIKDQQVNLAQAIAERRQTSKLFYDVVKRLVQFWLKLKTANLLGAMRVLMPTSAKQLASDHLAIQYGIRPLLSDLEGIAKTLAGPKAIEFDVIVRQRLNVPRALVGVYSGPAGVLQYADSVYSEGYTEVKYKYRCRIDSPSDAVLQTFTALGLGNLQTLAWELTPFSFVVDWALPIGNYLNSMDAFNAITVVHASKTVFSKEYVTFKRVFGGTASGWKVSAGTFGFVNERVKCVRTLLSTPPVLPLPSFKDPVSTLHIANALALLVQLRK